jgi:hypothetical protein
MSLVRPIGFIRNIIIFTSLLLITFSLKANACNNNYCQYNSTCVHKIGEPVSLVCFDQMQWYKSPDKFIGTSGSDNNDKLNYDIELCVISTAPPSSGRPRRDQVLTIKNLTSSDNGLNTYYAKVVGEQTICNYNIFVYGEFYIYIYI